MIVDLVSEREVGVKPCDRMNSVEQRLRSEELPGGSRKGRKVE
jgi:hypothetical protein